MENKFIQNSINAMILYAENFKVNCRLASLQDDNTTSREEEKLLKKINKITDEYIKQLRKL
ncbi:MAG: hypothetical protein II126_03750 [Erysipelotrichaceae bacterium]|nr:hypothetical protein [Erysipelotrichaceae bacterium]